MGSLKTMECFFILARELWGVQVSTTAGGSFMEPLNRESQSCESSAAPGRLKCTALWHVGGGDAENSYESTDGRLPGV